MPTRPPSARSNSKSSKKASATESSIEPSPTRNSIFVRRTYTRDPLPFWLGAVPSLLMAGAVFSGPAWSDLWTPGDYWGFFMPGAIFTAFGLVILYRCGWVRINLDTRQVTTYRAGVIRRRRYALDEFEKVTVSPEEAESTVYLVRLVGSGYELTVAVRHSERGAQRLATELSAFTGLPL